MASTLAYTAVIRRIEPWYSLYHEVKEKLLARGFSRSHADRAVRVRLAAQILLAVAEAVGALEWAGRAQVHSARAGTAPLLDRYKKVLWNLCPARPRARQEGKSAPGGRPQPLLHFKTAFPRLQVCHPLTRSPALIRVVGGHLGISGAHAYLIS